MRKTLLTQRTRIGRTQVQAVGLVCRVAGLYTPGGKAAHSPRPAPAGDRQQATRRSDNLNLSATGRIVKHVHGASLASVSQLGAEQKPPYGLLPNCGPWPYM